MESAEVLEWCQGGHWCVECRQAKGPKSKYRALSGREKEEYEEALLLHKNSRVKKMARLCDAHGTPSRHKAVIEKSSWDSEGKSTSKRKRTHSSSSKSQAPPPKLVYEAPATCKEVDELLAMLETWTGKGGEGFMKSWPQMQWK